MNRFIFGAIVIVIAITLAFTAGKSLVNKYIFAEEAPVQPINFSHKIHAGDNKIPCQFCHIYASRSKVAGVPSVQKCMGCHQTIRKDSPEIKKLHTYWNQKKTIPWIKIYDVADYIYFPHKRHVRAGVKCQACHGQVQEMSRVKKLPDLVMGWCLDCHRKRSFIGPDGLKRHGPRWDCWACHV